MQRKPKDSYKTFGKNKNTQALLEKHTMITYGILLIVIGIILAIIEIADPGMFIAPSILIMIGFIAIIFGLDSIFSFWTILAFILLTFPLFFISKKYHESKYSAPIPTTTTTTLKGQEGYVVKEVEPGNISGKVKQGSGSKIWSATADEKIEEGAKVKITEAKGVHIVVEKIE